MRQPFAHVGVRVTKFDDLVDINGPFLAVFEMMHGEEPSSFISIMGSFERAGDRIKGQIAAKEHVGLEAMMLQTEAFRKARDTQGKLLFTNVAFNSAALRGVLMSPELNTYINPDKAPEDAFPVFTDTRMALMDLGRLVKVEPDFKV